MAGKQIVWIAVLALAACRPSEEPAAPETAAANDAPAIAEPSSSIASTEHLAGEYRIAGVDRREIELPYGITASITADRIHVTADCVNLAWNYRFEGAALGTERAPVEGCGRGLSSEEEAIVMAFDSAREVSRTSANGMEFSGGGHSVLLFSQ